MANWAPAKMFVPLCVCRSATAFAIRSRSTSEAITPLVHDGGTCSHFASEGLARADFGVAQSPLATLSRISAR